MKSLCWLTEKVLASCGLSTGVNTARDLVTVQRRVKDEGDSFLTITLPAFCAAIERSLALGAIDTTMARSFAFHAGLPKLFSGFLCRIFDNSGSLLDEPDIGCIRAVRQVCLLHKKILRPCSDARMEAAERSFVETDDQCAVYKQDDTEIRAYFRKVSGVIVSDLLSRDDYGLPEEWNPRHGPGANTTRAVGNRKWNFTQWYARHEWFFPFQSYGCGSYREAIDRLLGMDHSVVEPTLICAQDEPPVKVVFVPKTLKTPRVIAVESQAMQYAQQAVRHHMVAAVEGGHYTRGRINFSDQRVNQSLALECSASGKYATLDMKNASDLVSLAHVEDMFAVAPDYLEVLKSVRTQKALLPNGVVMPLQKYASMGSAVCFPVEAIAFFCAIVAARLHTARLPVTPATVSEAVEGVYVYGDDLICPADEASAICECLELLRFQVNRGKSFWTGKFRESCGEDAYDGERVTPIYCRRDCPADRLDAQGVVSWVSMANQFYLAGLWGAAEAVREAIDGLFRVPLPFVSRNSPSVGWISFSERVEVQRWNKRLHRFETRGWVPTPSKREDPLEGDPALLKCLHVCGVESVDAKHLSHSVETGALILKHQWVPA